MARRRKGFLWRLGQGLLVALGAWIAVTLATVIALRWVHPPLTAFMLLDRVRAFVDGDESYHFRYEWRDWEQISRNAALAVVAAEDQQFPSHYGFDFAQIDRALQDRERGRRVRGASTISQQVAKNLFLWPAQSWFRKGLEAGLTVLIELAWPKQRILEMYLNVAEFGRGTFGAQAAARRFFGKDASRLSRQESALLAAVLPAPKRFRADAPSKYVRQRQGWIVRQMQALGGPDYVSGLE